MKYTRDDVIISRKQAEEVGLKVGDIVYYANSVHLCVTLANKDSKTGFVEDIEWEHSDQPFKVNGYYQDCVIMKKEPEKKVIPFDFSLEEDRNAVIGKRILHESLGFDGYIWSFVKYKNGWQAEGMSAEDLKRNAVFADTGKPVGKEITI